MRSRTGYEDAHGQPAASFRARENILKTVEHLLGLCRGITADGEVTEKEVVYLANWMSNNFDVLADHPVGRLLMNRVERIIGDGIITAEEREDLRDSLEQILGGGLLEDGGAGGLSSAAGSDASGQAIEFAGRRFVVTGKFLYGPRRLVESAIVERGGVMGSVVTQSTHYVIVGTMGSRDWAASSFGTKLEAVYELQEQGSPIRIIAEPFWVDALKG